MTAGAACPLVASAMGLLNRAMSWTGHGTD